MEMDKIYAIIPVNQFANAKTRLSPFLSPEERKNLLKAMLKDIAITLKPIVDDIIIISKDEEVLAYAEELELPWNYGIPFEEYLTELR
jgi:2-phospho-L-lactate guanylyltransferase